MHFNLRLVALSSTQQAASLLKKFKGNKFNVLVLEDLEIMTGTLKAYQISGEAKKVDCFQKMENLKREKSSEQKLKLLTEYPDSQQEDRYFSQLRMEGLKKLLTMTLISM